jgi:hypothetical protein
LLCFKNKKGWLLIKALINFSLIIFHLFFHLQILRNEKLMINHQMANDKAIKQKFKEHTVGRIHTVTNSNSNKIGTRKKTVGREIVIGPNAIKFVAIAIFAILALVYLTQSTAGANRSVKVGDLEGKKVQLQLEKERLQSEQTRLRSLKEIDNGIEKTADTMEPASTVGYVN